MLVYLTLNFQLKIPGEFLGRLLIQILNSTAFNSLKHIARPVKVRAEGALSVYNKSQVRLTPKYPLITLFRQTIGALQP